VIDAVSHLGVRHIDMPCTAERVWAAIRSASVGDADPWSDPPAVFATLSKGDVDEAGERNGDDSRSRARKVAKRVLKRVNDAARARDL
jgi:carbon-monoxide dehydrogenase large subunit